MNLNFLAKAFALFAVGLMMSMSLAGAAETSIVEKDLEGRTLRLQDAVEAVGRGDMTAVPEARAALADAPDVLRSSQTLRDLDELLATLENPVVAKMMAPLLASGALDGSTEELAMRAATMEGTLQNISASIGIDTDALASQWAALQKSTEGLDTSDPTSLEADIRALPEERLQSIAANLAAFTAAWNQTSGTDVAQRMDELAQAVLAHPTDDILANGELDAVTYARYQDTIDLLDEIHQSLSPEDLFDATGEVDYDAEIWDAYKGDLRGRLEDAFTALGADQDAFFADPMAQDPTFPSERSGLVAIDGVPIAAAKPALVGFEYPSPVPTSSLAEASARLPADLAVLDAPLAPISQPTSAAVRHKDQATNLGLPGANGVDFPINEWNSARSAENFDDSPGAEDPIFFSQIFLENDFDYRGTLNATDTADVYKIHLAEGFLYHIMLQVPANTNADLRLRCIANDRDWSSASTSQSDRPYFDSITFVLNPAGIARNEAFTRTSDPDPSASVCPGGDFFLWIKAPASAPPTGEVKWLLRTGIEAYTEKACSPTEWASCGLNWARWGDRCKDWDTNCTNKHPSVSNSRNYTTDLAGGRQQPVVFVHGVGDLGYNTFVDMESHSYRKTFSIEGVTRTKAIVTLVGSAVVAFGTVSFMSCAQSLAISFAAGPSLIGALVSLTMFTLALASWSILILTIFKVFHTVMAYWRNNSWDENSHFWNVRGAGYETYFIEYNALDNNAVEARKHIQRAGWQIKFGISAIQQDFYDRHHKDPNFPYASPEDVKVDLVVHSMGGLTTRFYTVVPGVDGAGNYQDDVREGPTYRSNLYEADVNKWISIQTPNMGSSVAKAGLTIALGGITVMDLISVVVGIAVGACFGGGWGLWWSFTKMVTLFIVKEIGFPLYVFNDLSKRDQLIPGRTPVVDNINARSPAPDIDYGIIYGLAFPGILLNIKRFDILVAENDALGPPQLKAVMASYPVTDDHGAALFAGPVRVKLHQWLANPDSSPLPGESGALASAEGLPSDAAAMILAAAAPPGRTLLETFGQVDAAALDTEPGAKYAPDGGALATPAPVRTVETLGGDRAMKLQRLAIERGHSREAQTFAAADSATRDALAQATADPGNASAIVNSHANSSGSQVRANGIQPDINQVAPDIGILRAGHSRDAQALLEAIAEPSVFLAPSSPDSQFRARDILLVPTGALSGADAQLQGTLERFAANGGTILALAQARGADLAALPGAPEGFGFTEEDGAYRDSVVFGTFTPALAGQSDTKPDVSVDGSLTKLPDGATVHLRSAKNARPVLASYPYGEGQVIVSALLSDWARTSGRGTSADTVLLRDLIADARSPDATAIGAPGAAFTVAADLSAVAGDAASATLVLVDDGAREVTRATFDLSGGASLSWEVPENKSSARHYFVDVIFRDAEGAATSKLLNVLELYASHYAANPGGFRPSFAPGALDVTSTSDRAETGAVFEFDLRVTNLQEDAADFVVGYWLPEHATLTGDATTYGAGAPRNGAAAAWDDNFQLRETVTVPAGGSVTLTKTLAEVKRSDSVSARLYDAAGTSVLGEARRAFTAYTSTVQLNLTTNSPHYTGGDAIDLTIVARDTAAPADAGARVASLGATLRGPTGAIVASTTGSVLVGPTEHTTTLTLTLPADAATGAYVASVDARLGALRIGSATTNARVPGAQLVSTVTLPASFEAGVPSTVTYTVRDPGPQPIVDATFTARLVNPAGVTEWMQSVPLALAAGGSDTLTFDVTPTSAMPGTYRLAYSSLIDGIDFAGETPILAGATATVTMPQSSYRARDAFAATVRVVNDGRFTLPLAITASAASIDAAAASPTLAPGAFATLDLAGTVPADVTAGAHNITITLTLPDGARTITRAFTVPPARVALSAPAQTEAAAGDILAATLANTGGVDALVPWAARLADETGRVVTVASGEAAVVAGGSAPIELAVPAQARTGAYRISLSADTGASRAATASKTIAVSGVSGTVALTAPLSVAPGGDMALSATPTSTGAPLEAAQIELTAIRPSPLPAWVALAGTSATSALDHAGARWFGTDAGLVRVDSTTGAATTVTTANGLPSNRIASLAVARGMLHVGTDRGLAWLDGNSWQTLTNLAPLPTKDVRALAGNANEVFLSTEAGVARYDGVALSVLTLPANAARGIAADEDELWVALADVTTGFAGTDVQPLVKTGKVNANPSIAVAPDGDVHVIYADNVTGSTTGQLLHVHLSAEGALLSGPHIIRNGTGNVALTGLAADSAGGLHAVWEDYRIAGDADVYYRKIGPDGELLSNEIAIGLHSGTSQRWARVIAGPNDVIYVAWADDRDPNPPGATTTRGSELYFAKVNADGTLLLPQTRLSHSSGNVLIPRIAVDGAGNVHAAYTDRVKRCDPQYPQYCYDNLETFYQKWDANGQQLVTPKILSPQDDTISYLPGLAVEANGDVDVIYQELTTNGGLRLARVDSSGNMITNNVRLTSVSGQRPQLLPRADGLMDVIWADYHTGKSEAWHNVLSPEEGAFRLANPARINAPPAPGDASQVVNGFAVSVTSSSTGRVYAAWDDQRNASAPQWRIGFSATRFTGKGVAHVDLAGAPTTTLTKANGALPSDDVLGLAMEGDLAAFITPEMVSLRDARTGAIERIGAPRVTGPAAVHDGRAFVATDTRGLVIDPDTRDVRALDAGGPMTRALAAAPDGVLVAGADGAALLRDDREDRFGTQLLAAAPGAASVGHVSAPSEQGRYRVRATLLAETGQTLATSERDVHVVEGELAVTISPAKSVVASGEPIDILVSVGNRGTAALRNVRTTLDAGGTGLLDETIDLAAGEARTFSLSRAAAGSYDLVATASGTPAALAGSTTRLTSTARDHVTVAPAALTARILAPDVATREPVSVGALLLNAGPLPLALSVRLEGGAARALVVPAHARIEVQDLASVIILEDTTLRLLVSGDAVLAREQRVFAGDRTLFVGASGLTGAAGERVATLSFKDVGTLSSAFPLTLALDGNALAPVDASVVAGATLALDVPLTLTEGLHELTYATPWESGALRVVASDAAVPLVTMADVRVAGGNASADLNVENAGPGKLLGSLDVTFGFKTETFEVDLAEGASLTVSPSASLAGIAPGNASVKATLLRDGASAAEVTRTYVVPGPILSFINAPGDLDAAPGDAITLTYEVENIGAAFGPVDVSVAVGGADAATKQVQLAPGERATLAFETRVEADARDGALAIVASGPGASATSALRITGARVDASGALDAPLYVPDSTATLSVNVTNLASAPADLVVRALFGSQSLQTPLALAAGATDVVQFPLNASVPGEVTWTVALASGRGLAQGAAPIRLDTLAGEGVRVTSDVDEVAVGGLVNITVTTAVEGRFDILGPGIRDDFTLNGTQTRTYQVPATVRADRYTMLYNFDATNATGTLPLAVRGQEIESLRFTLADATGDALAAASPNNVVQATWIVRSAVAGPAVVRAWLADATGAAGEADTFDVTLAAGPNTIQYPVRIADLEAGAAQALATIELPGVESGDTLAKAAYAFTVRGFSLRDARIEVGDGLDYALHLEMLAVPAQDAAVAVVVSGAAPLLATLAVDGIVEHALDFVAPEPGGYNVLVDVTSGAASFKRSLVAQIPGVGLPPVTTFSVEGTTWLRDDGVLVLSPTARIVLTATDDASGVAATYVRDDEGRDVPSDGYLTAGYHNITYHSADFAAHQELPRTVALLVDGDAPTLALVHPQPGEVHIAGALVQQAPGVAIALPLGLLPPLPLEAVDTDGDGYTDAEELVEGSDANNSRSTPARFMPAPPPPSFEKPIFAIGAVRVDASALDEGAGVKRIAAYLDGIAVATTTEPIANWSLDLSDQPAGDHVLTLLTEDLVGNVRSVTMRVQLLPTGSAGALATDPTSPRLHPFAPAMSAWLADATAALPDALQQEALRREARAVALQQQTDREVVQPLTPLAVDEAPGQIQRDLDAVNEAVNEIVECCLGG